MQPGSFYWIRNLASMFSVYRFDLTALKTANTEVSYTGYLKYIDEYLNEGVLFECFLSGNMKSIDDVKSRVHDRIESLLKDLPIGNVNTLQPHWDGYLVIPPPWRSMPSSSVDFCTVVSLYISLFFPAFAKGNENACV